MKAFSGFVSNLNKSMMRCRLWCVLCVLAHRSGLACSLRLYESQISKLSRASGLDEGQPNNRELNEPSRRAVRALRQSQFNWTRLEKLFLSVRPNYNSTWSYLHGQRGLCLGAAVNAVTPVVEAGAQLRAPLWSKGFQRSLSSVPSFEMSSYRRIW